MKSIFAEIKTGCRDERGQTLVLVVLCSLVLMGFLGLAIDVGNARTSERKMQQAADAAAIAAVLEIQACSSSPCTEMKTASTKAISENGLSVASANVYTNTCTMPALTGSTPAVTGTNVPFLVVNWGPCLLGSTADPNYNKTTYVEAAIGENQPSYFANVFGIHTFAVEARAEAKIANSPWCIFAQHQLEVGSGGQISANCGGYTDGDIVDGAGGNKNSCNGTHISLSQIDAAGTACKSNQISPTPVSGAPVKTDPLSYLTDNYTPPSSVTSACQPTGYVYPWGTTSPIVPSGTWTLYPSSTYAFCAPTAGGNALEVSSGATLLLEPGPAGCSGSSCDSTFMFNGNVQIDGGGATITSVDPVTSTQYGVTLYFAGTGSTGGALTVAGSGNQTNINLYAPTGCYGAAESWQNLPGILYWENSADTESLTMPNGYKTIWQGAIYLPGTGATIYDSSGSNSTMGAYTVFDAYNIELNDGAQIGSNYSSLCGGSPIKSSIPTLAE